MYLISAALAAPPTLDALATQGAIATAHCDDLSTLTRFAKDAPGPAAAALADAHGPMTLAVFPNETLPVVWFAKDSTPATFEAMTREDGDQRVLGSMPAPSARVLPPTVVAKMGTYTPGCVAAMDLASLSRLSPMTAAASNVDVESQLLLHLPAKGGPLDYSMTSASIRGTGAPSKHLDIDLRVDVAPVAVIVSDAAADYEVKDPKARKRVRQVKAAFPVDGIVMAVWGAEKVEDMDVAASISFSKNLRAKAIGRRISLACRKAGISCVEEGGVYSASVPAVMSAIVPELGKNPAMGAAASKGLTVYLEPQDGRVWIALSPESLARLHKGGDIPLVSADMRQRLQTQDLVATVAPLPKISAPDAGPMMFTVRSEPGWLHGTLDVPANYFDFASLKEAL